MKFRLTILSIVLLGFSLTPGFAQDQNKPDQSKPTDTTVSTAPTFRSSGLMYVMGLTSFLC